MIFVTGRPGFHREAVSQAWHWAGDGGDFELKGQQPSPSPAWTMGFLPAWPTPAPVPQCITLPRAPGDPGHLISGRVCSPVCTRNQSAGGSEQRGQPRPTPVPTHGPTPSPAHPSPGTPILGDPQGLPGSQAESWRAQLRPRSRLVPPSQDQRCPPSPPPGRLPVAASGRWPCPGATSPGSRSASLPLPLAPDRDLLTVTRFIHTGLFPRKSRRPAPASGQRPCRAQRGHKSQRVECLGWGRGGE